MSGRKSMPSARRAGPGNGSVYDDKIISSLERLSHLFRLMLWDAAKVEKLSPIQMSILMFLDSHPKRLCTVSHLAREFCLTKATVSDAVKSLDDKQLIVKKPSDEDGRVSTLGLYPRGKKLVDRLGGWTDSVREPLCRFPSGEKESAALFLMDLIGCLREAGVIKAARMCVCCASFVRDARPGASRPHICGLTGRTMGNDDMKMDCDNFEYGGRAYGAGRGG